MGMVTSTAREPSPLSLRTYPRSPSFTSNLKLSTKRVYPIVLDRFRAKHGHRLVADLPRWSDARRLGSGGGQPPACSATSGWARPRAAAFTETLDESEDARHPKWDADIASKLKNLT
jgi:hypothetical protein